MAMSSVVATLAVVATHLAPTAQGQGTAVDPTHLVAQGHGTLDQRYAKVLEAAAELGTVPLNLSPPLNKAAADKPALYRDGCDMAFQEVRPGRLCAYGDTSSATTVVLFGDSHAGHWFPALERVARQRHWKLIPLTKSACSVASTLVYLPALKRPYHECVQWRQYAINRIRALRPSMVVMSSNGGGALPVGATGDADQVWVDAWQASIRSVAAPSTRLVLLLDTPWPHGNVPDCISAHLSDARECTRPPKRAVIEPRRREMLAAAAGAAGVRVVDPLAWFCTSTNCPVIVGNALVYRDDSHITTTYASTLAPMLASQLPAPVAALPPARIGSNTSVPRRQK
jgi:hypothetical protein